MAKAVRAATISQESKSLSYWLFL